eukprot:c28073_g1_i1 orf=144-326(+)
MLLKRNMCETKINERGSAATFVNIDGETSLHIASTHRHVEVCEMILKYDAASLSMLHIHG